jgi:hypothetical protein
MSPLLDLDEARLAEQLFPIIASFEADIAKAEPLFKISGARLEQLARDLPQHQAFYSQRSKEARAIVKILEGFRDKIESRLLKNHMQGARAYSARENQIFIAGTSEIVQHNQLMQEVSLLQAQLESIVESFVQMGWMLGHIVKLKVAELNDVVL